MRATLAVQPQASSPGRVPHVRVGELHAAFLNESRTRRYWWHSVQEIRIRGPKTTGEAHQTISLYRTAGKDLRKKLLPQKENPEGYDFSVCMRTTIIPSGPAEPALSLSNGDG